MRLRGDIRKKFTFYKLVEKTTHKQDSQKVAFLAYKIYMRETPGSKTLIGLMATLFAFICTHGSTIYLGTCRTLKVGQRLRDISTITNISFKPILLETLFLPLDSH